MKIFDLGKWILWHKKQRKEAAAAFPFPSPSPNGELHVYNFSQCLMSVRNVCFAFVSFFLSLSHAAWFLGLESRQTSARKKLM